MTWAKRTLHSLQRRDKGPSCPARRHRHCPFHTKCPRPPILDCTSCTGLTSTSSCQRTFRSWQGQDKGPVHLAHHPHPNPADTRESLAQTCWHTRRNPLPQSHGRRDRTGHMQSRGRYPQGCTSRLSKQSTRELGSPKIRLRQHTHCTLLCPPHKTHTVAIEWYTSCTLTIHQH